ncbi:DNA cytosine methyltransferase [Micromonospora sp. URMC 103]|uniref:DNA cytosine methyltransferase n=1 Tax=Micromonospora sp. URMC 103 TaxID=3423406 RepID=UPI003F1C10E1
MTYRILDLCCCQGGAARGYAQAGFEVVGVDVDPQPRYPYEFIQADALEVLRDRTFVGTFDAIHASWPCQAYSPLNALPTTKAASEHPDLVGPGRELMAGYDMPWVIENVMAAPLDRNRSIVLCGGMFGLRTYRHRRFEPSPGLTLVAPAHPKHVIRTATKRRRELWAQGWHVSITGDVGTYVGPEAMGIDWMTGNGLSEAIPPAYTRLIGEQIIAALDAGTWRQPTDLLDMVGAA